jgi:hypothetical protein
MTFEEASRYSGVERVVSNFHGSTLKTSAYVRTGYR